MMETGSNLPTVPPIHVPKLIPQRKISHSKRAKEPLQQPQETKIVENPKKSEPVGQEIQNKNGPKLCSNCSVILLQYFRPLQSYINEIINLAENQTGSPSEAFKLLPFESFKTVDDNQCGHINVSSKTDDGRDNTAGRDEQHSHLDHHQDHHHHNSPGYNQNQTNTSHADYQDNVRSSQNASNQQKSSHQPNSQSSSAGNQQSQHDNYQAVHSRQNNERSHGNDHYDQNSNQSLNQTSNQNDNISYNNPNVEGASINESNNAKKTCDQTIEGHNQQGNAVHESKTSDGTESKSKGNITTNLTPNMSTNLTTNTSNNVTTNMSTNPELNQFTSTGNSNSSIEFHDVNDTSDRNRPVYGKTISEIAEEEEVMQQSPFAICTVAYNNLSAINAVILANSIKLRNNKTLQLDEAKPRNIAVPLIILLDGVIDPCLYEAIEMVYDEVIEDDSSDVRISLLNDQSFGIQLYKLQLWRVLQKYKKCLFLESSCLVVGEILNMLLEFGELSACVDALFSDFFNCSVFIFEPSEITYEELVNFAVSAHQNVNKNGDAAENIDEMTILNRYFAPKWNRISFIYNFVPNSTIYTQQPAFMKFGGAIKIVNFGHMLVGNSGFNNQQQKQVGQPWYVLFDLLTSSQSTNVVTSTPVSEYVHYYLDIFMKRIWPLLQQPITPILMSRSEMGRREWSIFELVRLLTSQSGIETDDTMFTQFPITFRRLKSPTESPVKYSTKNFNPHPKDLKSVETQRTVDKLIIKDKESDTPKQSEPLSEVDGEEGAEKDLDTESDTTVETVVENTLSGLHAWESGKADWMGAHSSDGIIERLKGLITKK